MFDIFLQQMAITNALLLGWIFPPLAAKIAILSGLFLASYFILKNIWGQHFDVSIIFGTSVLQFLLFESIKNITLQPKHYFGFSS